MENESLLLLVEREDAFLDFIWNVFALVRAGQIQSLRSLERADFDDRVVELVTHLLTYEFLGSLILEQFVHVLSVERVVLRASFPSDDVVCLGLRVVEFDHEFELEALIWTKLLYLGIRYLGDPEVAISPLHLHATATAVLVGVPAAKELR